MNKLDGEVAPKNISILGVPFSHGEEAESGTELGPEVVRTGGLIEMLEMLGHSITDIGDLDLYEETRIKCESLVAKNDTIVGAVNKKVANKVQEVLRAKESLIVLGGDRSLPIGEVYGHLKEKPDTFVVWIDAHADLNTPLTRPNRNMFGMSAAYLLEETQEYIPVTPGFDWLKPCMNRNNMAFVGLRGVRPGDRYLIDTYDLPTFSMVDIDEFGIAEITQRLLKKIDSKSDRPIQINIDMDSIDPAVSPAVGYPVPGGLSVREATYLIEKLAATGNVEIVCTSEINPKNKSDADVAKTAKIACLLLCAAFGKQRLGSYPKGYVQPRPDNPMSSIL